MVVYVGMLVVFNVLFVVYEVFMWCDVVVGVVDDVNEVVG